MKQKIMACLCACALAVVCAVPVMAADGNSGKVGIVSSDPATGITVYRDSGGATVLSGLPVPYTASPEEQA